MSLQAYKFEQIPANTRTTFSSKMSIKAVYDLSVSAQLLACLPACWKILGFRVSVLATIQARHVATGRLGETEIPSSYIL